MRRQITRPQLVHLENRVQPAASAVIAFGADAGGLPYVRLYDPTTQSQVRAFLAYDPSFTGGVRVAQADVNGDGVPDVVTGVGPGGGPHVKLFDGRTGALILQFFAYSPTFTGGVNVAIGDVTGDGKADIITGTASGGGPHVKVFDLNGDLERQFFAYGASFTGGVNVAIGDVNGDGRADIITGAGPGGGPHVKVFDGSTGVPLAGFFAYAATFHGGVSVAAAALTEGGSAEIIAGAGPGGGPHVRVFDGSGALKSQFFAFDASFTGGVRVGADSISANGQQDILVAAGLNGNARWRAFDPATQAKVADRVAFAFPFAGGVSLAGNSPAPIAEANADAVIAWNKIAQAAIQATAASPPAASRGLAMVSAAVYDAVNAVVPLHPFYHSTPTLQPTADLTAAASQAAHDVLVSLFPTQTATFDAALTTWLNTVADPTAKADGVLLGQQTAADIIAWRATDGSNVTITYVPGTGPGEWQPTPPAYAPALSPQWGSVTPFAMTTSDQFRSNLQIPSLTSDEYTQAYNEVMAIGGTTSTIRTPDETQIAEFWADAGGTVTPPGHWNEIADSVSLHDGLSLVENARLFLVLNLATADAGITSWSTKFTDNFWRPVTAIRAGDTDGNPLTTADPTWTPLIVTPPFPATTSGHSTFSGAASTVLTAEFGDHYSFSDRGDPSQPATRSFDSFSDAADEAGMSRIYGGIHWTFDNTSGLASGRALGQYVVQSRCPTT